MGCCCCGQISANIWRLNMEVWGVVALLNDVHTHGDLQWYRQDESVVRRKLGAGWTAVLHRWMSTGWIEVKDIVVAASKDSASPAEEKSQVPESWEVCNHLCQEETSGCDVSWLPSEVDGGIYTVIRPDILRYLCLPSIYIWAVSENVLRSINKLSSACAACPGECLK